AERFIEMLKKTDVEVKTSSMVLNITQDKKVSYVNPTDGYVTLQAKAIILAMGCRERTRGAIAIPGFRPSGVWTAGTAQKYLNMDGYLVGKKVFILGSGDIGLIMARRMTLEGARVLGVAELMPYSNGLPRNMKQCLDDFDIPLYLSHTITKIHGKDRVEGVTIAKVDEKLVPIPGTEQVFDVDTILLSVGLIPENSLSEDAGVTLMPRTKGPLVSESLQTDAEGIFACGNVLHVHDLVDFVSREGEKAGKCAAVYLRGELKSGTEFKTTAVNGIGYVIPCRVNRANVEKELELLFRVTKNARNVKIGVYHGNVLVKTIKKPRVAPSEMEKILLKKEELPKNGEDLLIGLIEE
ncbi:MAG: FAD-dependent oxidoreductase, partial [Lachnospiraceae bacterium]|nr:FAD-dependent oxidoreductase [Lachnospiraceae bacterium]